MNNIRFQCQLSYGLQYIFNPLFCQYCLVSVTVFGKDYIQMHGMTCKRKHHKIQQTEIKYV